jgi:hypothetical protein
MEPRVGDTVECTRSSRARYLTGTGADVLVTTEDDLRQWDLYPYACRREGM